MRRYSRPLLIFLGVFLLPLAASAHQPVYIGSATDIAIPDPTTSRAYYGELMGGPAQYSVTLATTTKFYVNILAPDIAGAKTDFDAIMQDSSGKIVLQLLHGTPWPAWYEEFAGDTYLKGPEEKKDLPAGTYRITVDNATHSGKYVLAPGEAEVFTAGGTPENVREIYMMKTKFFGKPPYAIFEGVIGHALLGILIAIVLVILCGGYFLFRRKNSVHK